MHPSKPKSSSYSNHHHTSGGVGVGGDNSNAFLRNGLHKCMNNSNSLYGTNTNTTSGGNHNSVKTLTQPQSQYIFGANHIQLSHSTNTKPLNSKNYSNYHHNGNSANNINSSGSGRHPYNDVNFKKFSSVTSSKSSYKVGEECKKSGSNSTMSNSEKTSKKKGILKSKSAKSSNGKRGVSFPKEVVEVIGYHDDDVDFYHHQNNPTLQDYSYGGGDEGDEDEDDPPSHPLDNASIAELMETNSTTADEKEFQRLTQKNTNFNSIKTNLLGTTNIELGPIVGGTGGSSKPLVSIGTFESRNEPLRIGSAFGRGGGSTQSSSEPSKPKPTPPAASQANRSPPDSSSSMLLKTTTNKQVPTNVITTTSTATTSCQSAISTTTTSGFSSKKTTISDTEKPAKASNDASKPAVSKLSQSTPSFSTPALIKTVVTPLKTTSDSTSDRDKGSDIIVTQSVTISSGKQWNLSDPASESTPKPESIPESKNGIQTQRQRSPPSEKPPLKPKSILKLKPETTASPSIKAFGGLPKSPTTPTVTTAIPPIISNKNRGAVNLNSNPNTKSALSNLIVFSDANSIISSKRTSFLRDLINDSAPEPSANPTTTEKDSLEGKDESPPPLPPPALPSKLKINLDLKLDRSQAPLANPPQSLVRAHNGKNRIHHNGFHSNNNGNGSGTDSEFDDSLEDSGLDVKMTNKKSPGIVKKLDEEDESLSEESDGNEKLSGSDSGNENDYAVSTATVPANNGLFISVGDDEMMEKKAEVTTIMTQPKLSPDSVLFNSASGSESSASASSESIPEALNLEEASSQVSNERRRSSSSSTGSNKRQAPLPPLPVTPEDEHNSLRDELEGVYDDVVNLKMESGTQLEEEYEEGIYDDCVTTATIAPPGKKSGSQGSYNFAMSNGLNGMKDDPDGLCGDSPILSHKRNDGIEFIGIRKIDSESFLKERSPTPERRLMGIGFRRSVSPKNGTGSRERSSSTSPKTKRKVNQFFSTIGKKAGAAFSASHLGQYARNKSPSSGGTLFGHGANLDPNPHDDDEDGHSSSKHYYKRSLSTDEVANVSNATQIYATLTPTSLKFKGVLNKLSKIDLNLGGGSDKDKRQGEEDQESKGQSKNSKKQISKSIKKFLGFGNSKDISDKNGYGDDQSSAMGQHETSPFMSSSSSSSVPFSSTTRPPPPPPRIHSLDVRHVQMSGSSEAPMSKSKNPPIHRPARPPPPVRITPPCPPSFTSVFNHPDPGSIGNERDLSLSSLSSSIGSPPSYCSSPEGGGGPPSKPKRKNSVNHHQNGTSYNGNNAVSNVNLETLKLIANQPLRKISMTIPPTTVHRHGISWSDFSTCPSSLLLHGHGFSVYPARFQHEEDVRCSLLIQERTPDLMSFDNVQTEFIFEDFVPNEFVTWDDGKDGHVGVKVVISVLPPLSIWPLGQFLIHENEGTKEEKFLCLLQSLNYWETEDFHDLIVLKAPDNGSYPPDQLLFVVPKTGRTNKASSPEFEIPLKQLLFTTDDDIILSKADRITLIEKLSGCAQDVKSQMKLFLQLKLFYPPDLGARLHNNNSVSHEERGRLIQEWLDTSRAICMKEALEQSLGCRETGLTPYRKAHMEFLMRPGNMSNAIIELLF